MKVAWTLSNNGLTLVNAVQALSCDPLLMLRQAVNLVPSEASQQNTVAASQLDCDEDWDSDCADAPQLQQVGSLGTIFCETDGLNCGMECGLYKCTNNANIVPIYQ